MPPEQLAGFKKELPNMELEVILVFKSIWTQLEQFWLVVPMVMFQLLYGQGLNGINQLSLLIKGLIMAMQ